MTSAAESFLIGFHARFPGVTSEAFGELPVRCGAEEHASSYELLAARLPAQTAALLDLACGDGHLLRLIAGHRARATLVGVDMSRGELAAARGTRAGLVQCKAQVLPFGADAFDAVTSHMALMLMDDTPRVLAEIRRVLRPGGALVAVVGARSPPSPAADAYLEVLREQLATSPAPPRLGDRSWRTADGGRRLVEAAGFTDVQVEGVESAVDLTPEASWHWFTRMYDLYFVDDSAHAGMRAAYLRALGPAARVTLPIRQLLLTATAP